MWKKITLSKKTAGKLAGAGFLASAVWSGYNYVGPDQFGLRETLGNVTSDVLPPGLYFNIPFVQYTHSYQANLQTIEYNAGSCLYFTLCPNTADQNALSSVVAINYRVIPDVEKLSWHRWSMDGWKLPDGFWLLRGMMNDSANAVLGRKTMAQTMLNPQQYAADFYQDLSYRLEQNNVPVHLESIELKEFRTLLPVRAVTYARQPAAPDAARP